MPFFSFLKEETYVGKRKPRLCKVCGKEFHSETGRTCCSDIDWEEKSRENHYWSIKFARLEKLLGGRLRGAKSSRFFAC